MINKRVLVSFDGACPFYCKHCYTYGLEQGLNNRSIEEIIKSIEKKDFDIIYVSQKKENFANPDEGILLCELLYNRYHTDIMAITRNVFDEKQINRLRDLDQKMRNAGKQIFLAVSISAIESAGVTEDLERVPSPYERINFLRDVSKAGITTFLVIRPLYPQTIIPISEVFSLVDKSKNYVSGILSSGLAVNKTILDQLGLDENDFLYSEEDKSDYFVGAIEDIKFTNVKKELKMLRDYCKKHNIPFFSHSLPAINYMKEQTCIL